MAYTFDEPRLGMLQVAVIDTGVTPPNQSTAIPTPPNKLGSIVRAFDPTYGEGEFILLKGVASTIVGSPVIYDGTTYLTTLAPATSNQARPIAISMTANTLTSGFAWYQIGGTAVGAKASSTVINAKVAVGIATTGLIGNTATGKEIEGARSANAATASTGTTTITLILDRPAMQGPRDLMEIEVRCAYSDALIYSNIRANSRACSNWLKTSDAHDGHAVIVGGGPSVADKMPLIKRRLALGQTCFALNGAGRFLNEHGIVPDYQVFLDCLPDLHTRIGEAKNYLIGSQCDPVMLASVPNPILWHTAIPDVEDHLDPARKADGGYNLIGGGGITVGLCTMALAYSMGFRKIHLFGYDSSNKNGQAHAYSVEGENPNAVENIGGIAIGYVDVTLNDNKFQSTLSMTRQAEIFPDVCNALLEKGCTVTVDVDEQSLMAEVLRIMNATQPLAA